MWFAFGHLSVGHMDVAARIIARTVERDPLNPMILLLRGLLPFFEGRLGEAATLCAVPYGMSPGNPMVVHWHALTLAYAGRTDDCRAVVDRIARDPGDDVVLRLALMIDRALALDRDGMNALVTPALDLYARHDGQSAWTMAACYAKLGDAEPAFAWLEHAIARDFIPVRFLATIDPFLASLRGASRFEALMDRARGRQRAIDAALG
jgi:hypothetical protein